MQFKITSNSKQVDLWVKRNVEQVQKKAPRAMKIAGQEAVNIIEDRTATGREIGLIRFKPYSAKYSKFRREKGRGKKPDLQFSGRMLGSMTSKVRKNTAIIYFTRAAEAKKAAMNQKKRPFFGLNRKDMNVLSDSFFKRLK